MLGSCQPADIMSKIPLEIRCSIGLSLSSASLALPQAASTSDLLSQVNRNVFRPWSVGLESEPLLLRAPLGVCGLSVAGSCCLGALHFDSSASDRMENDWVVAIPTFDRVQDIERRTLGLLQRAHIPSKRIFVFADPTQYARYEKQLRHLDVHILPGERGVCGQRNLIMAHFAPGTRIVEMDDDIDGVDVTTASDRDTQGATLARVPDTSVANVIDHLWEVSAREGCSLWGLYGVRNPFFMSHTYTVGLAKSTAQVQGYVNPGSVVKLTVPCMEDYERCLSLFAQGRKCLRANYLAVRTTNRGPGGCASAFTVTSVEVDPGGRKVLRHPRHVMEAEASATLRARYPNFVRNVGVPASCVKVVPVHGEVVYHPPGWRLQFPGRLSEKRAAGDVAGDFARLLGLGASLVRQAPRASPAGRPIQGNVDVARRPCGRRGRGRDRRRR
ncbi:unnamed protein product [Prorocentrum cordatum]|uniref:Uncharacterized protein n=1 Tax=Prorocentrum cordatum TaxID=2364126 RepID=A0ABN9T9X9_9DINO|nr:unnamed protein product [Polarella glacialis]